MIENSETIVGWTGGIAGLLTLINILWRMQSKTRLADVKDRGEGDLIGQHQALIKELREENKLLRERSDAAHKERNEAMAETARLRAEVELLKRDVMLANQHVAEAQRKAAEAEKTVAALVARVGEIDRRKG